MKYFAAVLSLACICALIAFNGCSSDSSMTMAKAGTYTGETKALGTGSFTSWVTINDAGNPTSAGVRFSESALAGLPKVDTMLMLMFPMMSGSTMMMAMPFDHVEISWAPDGDPAPSVYNKAHLDCHFFTVTSADQMMVKGGRDTTRMDAKYMPMDCMADSLAEEGMGVHWMDTTSKEFHGQPFDHTVGYGFYQGNMYFIEPMCAKSFLDSKASYTGDIKQPQAFRKSGNYPTKYSVKYDATTKEYTISIDNLVQH